MRRSVLLAGVTAVLLSGCTQEMSRSERAVQEQVLRDRLTAWSRVLNNRDADSLAAFYHQVPELTVAWPDGQRTRGWEEEAAAQREFFRGVVTMNLVVQDAVVEVLGFDAALTTFRYSADLILTSTERDIFSGYGTLVWTRAEGSDTWVIHTEHMSRNP